MYNLFQYTLVLQSDLLGSKYLRIFFQYVAETDLHLQYILYAYNHHHLQKNITNLHFMHFTRLLSTIIT